MPWPGEPMSTLGFDTNLNLWIFCVFCWVEIVIVKCSCRCFAAPATHCMAVHYFLEFWVGAIAADWPSRWHNLESQQQQWLCLCARHTDTVHFCNYVVHVMFVGIPQTDKHTLAWDLHLLHPRSSSVKQRLVLVKVRTYILILKPQKNLTMSRPVRHTKWDCKCSKCIQFPICQHDMRLSKCSYKPSHHSWG